MKDINKKVLILGICLLIIAGIIVVLLQGFKVGFMLEQHEAVTFIIGNDFELKDVKDICKEVFGDKRIVLRKVEIFNDAVNINVSSITDEEKENLITKMNEKYETTVASEDLTVETVSNIRIRDLLRPYIQPICISIAIIAIYVMIRFRKSNIFRLLGEVFGIVIVTEAALLSVIAITRFPLLPVVINILTIIAVLELIIYLHKKEKKIEEV